MEASFASQAFMRGKRALARPTLAVLLALAGCAERAASVTPEHSHLQAHAARVHLVTPKKRTNSARTDLAERDVSLAQRAFLAQSPERAAELYRAAAAHGSAVAEYNLGVFYEKGLGVPADRTQAEAWYRRAVNNRDPAVRTLASTGLASVTAKPSQAREDLLSLAP